MHCPRVFFSCTLSAIRPLPASLGRQGSQRFRGNMSEPAASKRRKVEASSMPATDVSVKSQAPVKLQGLVYIDHTISAPLDHFESSESSPATIDVFAREVVATNKQFSLNMPYLCFFQGGPGFEASRPSESEGWLREALKYFRVVLLDQRGTGRSAPVRASTLAAVGDAAAQAAYLKHFRADSIVQDAELVRQAIVPSDGRKGRWCILGQSFGGFCCVQYMSIAPQGLLEVFMTGGIPPCIDEPCGIDKVYKSLYQRVILQNEKYYSLYPDDVQRVKDVVKYLAAQPQGGVQTPAGSWLRPRSLQLLGLSWLGGGGGFERMHFALERALDYSLGEPEITPQFLQLFDQTLPWYTNPLYAVLHESCYSRGPATKWAAHRVRNEHYAEEFDAEAAAESTDRSVYFTGEMIYPWMFDDLAGLRPFKEVANLIAQTDDWSNLYDVSVLKQNTIPVAAATYCEDMYVDFNLAQQTAAHIRGIRQWMTNEYMHSGIRDDGARILDRLVGMNRGTIMLF